MRIASSGCCRPRAGIAGRSSAEPRQIGTWDPSAALAADVSLDLIGAKGRILVEGRFAEAEVFVRGMASLRPRDRIYMSNAHNDVSYGALRLIDPKLRSAGRRKRVRPLDARRDHWRRDAARAGTRA